MTKHPGLSRHAIFTVSSALLWGVIELLALWRSRQQASRH
jgi:hypothetical protein